MVKTIEQQLKVIMYTGIFPYRVPGIPPILSFKVLMRLRDKIVSPGLLRLYPLKQAAAGLLNQVLLFLI